MKRTCFGCRALDWNGEQSHCDLGYKQSRKYHRKALRSEPIPAEECPKPLTYERYFDLLDNAKSITDRLGERRERMSYYQEYRAEDLPFPRTLVCCHLRRTITGGKTYCVRCGEEVVEVDMAEESKDERVG